MLPILYSYRRCPYAMRARMALKYAGIQFEVREISLKEKPQSMLKVSPKGTVPVLVLTDDTLEQSLDIMQWAVRQQDADGWLSDPAATAVLINENDGSFKQALDRYKYAVRFPEQPAAVYRKEGEIFLKKLELMLTNSRFLLSNQTTLADIAIFPFIRQFSSVDAAWFETAPYPKLRAWLQGLIDSELFQSIMEKQPTYFD